MSRNSHICTLNLSGWVPPAPLPTPSATQKRLAAAFAYLEQLEEQRESGHYPVIGKFMEERIVWRELLELELQDADDQMARIWAATGEPLDQTCENPQVSGEI